MLLSCLCYPWCLYLLLHRLLTGVILQAWDSITDGGLPAQKEQPPQFDPVSQQPCGACWLSLMLFLLTVLLLLRAVTNLALTC